MARGFGWTCAGVLLLALGVCWAVELAYAAVRAQAGVAQPASAFHAWALAGFGWGGAACLLTAGVACVLRGRAKLSAFEEERDV